VAEVPNRDHVDVHASGKKIRGGDAESRRLPDAFPQSAQLPATDIIEELAARHQAFLDELDEEWGPPTTQDVERAERVLNQLEAGGA
jgi:hypothetical protein